MAEFVMVIALLMFIFLCVLQVALLLHVRDVMTADAAEAARYEAAAGAEAGSGAGHAKALLLASLSKKLVEGITCTSARAGQTVAITCAGDVGLSYLPGHLHFSVTSHALLEGR